MSLINSAIKTVAKPYTSKGYRLLSKSLNIPTSNNGTMDIVEIASEFGKGHTTITSLKMKKGSWYNEPSTKSAAKGIYTHFLNSREMLPHKDVKFLEQV